MEKEPVIINSAQDLTMDKFIECLVDKNLSVLTVSGDPTQEQLQQAWEYVYAEFCELTEHPGYTFIFNSMKEIMVLKARLYTIGVSLTILKFRNSADSIATLRKYGYDRPFDWSDQESFQKDLEWVKKASKNIHFTIIQRENELKLFVESQQQVDIKRTDFDNLFAVLSKFMGFQCDSKKLTVPEYAAYLKLMEKSRPNKHPDNGS